MRSWKIQRGGRNGKILVGVGAGTGITAKKCSEKGPADMLIIYNSGRFRWLAQFPVRAAGPMAIPIKSLWEWAPRCFPVVKNTPVLAGVWKLIPSV